MKLKWENLTHVWLITRTQYSLVTTACSESCRNTQGPAWRSAYGENAGALGCRGEPQAKKKPSNLCVLLDTSLQPQFLGTSARGQGADGLWVGIVPFSRWEWEQAARGTCKCPAVFVKQTIPSWGALKQLSILVLQTLVTGDVQSLIQFWEELPFKLFFVVVKEIV